MLNTISIKCDDDDDVTSTPARSSAESGPIHAEPTQRYVKVPRRCRQVFVAMNILTYISQHAGLIGVFRYAPDKWQGDNVKSDAFTVRRLAFRTNIELFPGVSRDQLDLSSRSFATLGQSIRSPNKSKVLTSTRRLCETWASLPVNQTISVSFTHRGVGGSVTIRNA